MSSEANGAFAEPSRRPEATVVLDWRHVPPEIWPPPRATNQVDPDNLVIRAARAARAKKSVLLGPVGAPVCLFVGMMALCFMHQGRVVELLYPGLVGAIALWLYRWHPAHYLGFTCWVFFLTPEVRRLADFFNGAFNAVSPIMVAPMLCASISGLTLLTKVKMLGQRRSLPLVLITAALLYAYSIGIVRAGFQAATFSLATAIFPALVGFRLISVWMDHPANERVLLNTFVFGCIVMGGYGVYEFINPPAWDAFWLLQSGMVNDGVAVPFGWRVAGTMNSSGPFANTLIICIVMALAGKGKLRVLAGIALPALMFTSVRSAWGGLILGLVYPIALLDGRSRNRILAGVLVCVALCAPVAMMSDASDHFTARLSTVQNLSEDNSFQVRMSMYSTFFTKALGDVAGQGFGGTGVASKLADDQSDVILVFDSGLMEVPYLLGWPGTLLYVTGIVMLLRRGFAASWQQPKDLVGACGVGAALAIAVMMVFSNTLTGVTGMFFFIGVLMPVNGLRYARQLSLDEQRLRAMQAQQAALAAQDATATRAAESAPPPGNTRASYAPHADHYGRTIKRQGYGAFRGSAPSPRSGATS